MHLVPVQSLVGGKISVETRVKLPTGFWQTPSVALNATRALKKIKGATTCRASSVSGNFVGFVWGPGPNMERIPGDITSATGMTHLRPIPINLLKPEPNESSTVIYIIISDTTLIIRHKNLLKSN